MVYTFHIDDASGPKAKAFLEYIKTLDFIRLDELEPTLSQQQLDAIEEARISIKQDGTSSTSEVMKRLKKKHPNAFD